ncbi:MAG: hypothetical protein II743_00890 [Lachnospiraceae bacterium]|nr:hypothetical protein [Lachnospiraceae bacterium]
MGNGRKRGLYRCIATMLSLTMILGSTGCGSNGNAEQSSESIVASSQVESQTASEESTEPSSGEIEESSSESTVASSEEAPRKSIKEGVEKEYVWDFDELVNAEWVEQAKEEHPGGYTKYDGYFDLMYQHFYDILENTDLSTLSPDSALYKAIYIYREQKDPSSRDKKINASIKARLDRIENAKSLEDLYELYADEEYCRYNRLMYIEVFNTEMGACVANLQPLTLMGDGETSFDEKQQSTLQLVLMRVGVSKNRANEIVKNAVAVDQKIISYYENRTSNNAVYVTQDMLNNQKVTVPVIEILEKLNSIGDSKTFWGRKEYFGFLNEMYQEENLQLIKDHMLATVMLRLAPYGADGITDMVFTLIYGEGSNGFSSLLRFRMIDIAGDILAQEYDRRFVRDPAIDAEARAMLEDVKVAAKEAFVDFPWVFPYMGKDFMEKKVDALEVYCGANAAYNDLSDIVITDDPIDNITSFFISQDRFERSYLQKKLEDREMHGIDMFEANGYYASNINKIMLCSGWLSMYANLKTDGMKEEEKLAILGATLAHEVGHAFDPYNIFTDYRGVERDWIEDKEWEKYNSYIDAIIDYFNDKDAGYGCKINGEQIFAEAFADMMGIGICMNLLDKMENPDYDLFFKTYAANWASYETEGYVKYTTTYDTHLPCKFRINYILGQFDEFYDTYDVDEKSPYFVPEEQRLKGLW